MNIETFGGRKFLLSVLIIFLSFVLILINRLPPDDYLKIAFAIIGLYTGLNVYQKIKVNKKINTKE